MDLRPENSRSPGLRRGRILCLCLMLSSALGLADPPKPRSSDLYERLGVSPAASTAEINEAFRKIAPLYHPDTHPGDKDAEEDFKKITEARDILKKSDARAQYDSYAKSTPRSEGSGPEAPTPAAPRKNARGFASN